MTTRDPNGAGPDMSDRDDKTIAAEFSLGLLEGEELMAARGRLISDPDFAWRKDWWDDWFVPLSDEISGVEPGDHVWQAINERVGRAQTDAESSASVADVAAHAEAKAEAAEAGLRRWRWTAAVTSAAAALAVAVLVAGPGSAPVSETENAPSFAQNTQGTAAPLMASMPVGDTLRLTITYLPNDSEMLVSASGLTADGVHDHELWLVPGDGSALQSLGVVAPGEERRMTLPEDVTRNMADGARLLLTREPLGGKPEGVDAGPVVAEAQFASV